MENYQQFDEGDQILQQANDIKKQIFTSENRDGETQNLRLRLFNLETEYHETSTYKALARKEAMTLLGFLAGVFALILDLVLVVVNRREEEKAVVHFVILILALPLALTCCAFQRYFFHQLEKIDQAFALASDAKHSFADNCVGHRTIQI